jgi:hypothetical protein
MSTTVDAEGGFIVKAEMTCINSTWEPILAAKASHELAVASDYAMVDLHINLSSTAC